MASITYRKKGNRWHIRFQAQGKKEIIKSLPGTLYEKTVAQKASWYQEQVSLGRVDPWRKTLNTLYVEDALAEFLEMNLQTGNWAADTTHRTNKNSLNRILKPICDYPLGDRTTKEVFQRVFNESNGNAFTKRGNRARLNVFLKYCYKEGYLSDSVTVDLPMKYQIEIRNTDEIKYITWHQLEDVCHAHRWIYQQNSRIFNTHHTKDLDFYPDLYWFMFYSLLRRFEVPKLKVGDLKGKKLTVRGKGRRTDVITLPPPALRIAQKYAEGRDLDEYLFVSYMNRPKIHLAAAIELALGKDHPTKGFHQLRHGGVVHYISLGKPIQFISKLARHKSIQVTLDTYADVLPDRMEDAFADVKHEPV
jgi:integrase